MIIDMLSESYCVSIKDTQVQFNEENFIKLITNKKDTLNDMPASSIGKKKNI
jgi:hypothetical protein